jgi:hypothetical protein
MEPTILYCVQNMTIIGLCPEVVEFSPFMKHIYLKFI